MLGVRFFALSGAFFTKTLDFVATMWYNVATEREVSKMKKSTVVRFRCTPEERKIIEDHARNDGLSLSEYLLRLVMLDQKRRIKEADFQAYEQLMGTDDDGCPFA